MKSNPSNLVSQCGSTDLLFDAFIESDLTEMAARILVVSLELFAQKGYAATSVREIVQKAEVTNPMLYYYFGNKEGVFNTLIDFLFDSMHEQIQMVIAQPTGFKERLEILARVQFQGCIVTPVVYQFIYAALFGPQLGRPKFDIAARREASLNLCIQFFDDAKKSGEFVPHQGLDSHFIVEQFFGLINNHIMTVLKFAENQECKSAHQIYLQQKLGDDALNQFIQFFLSGAGTLIKG